MGEDPVKGAELLGQLLQSLTAIEIEERSHHRFRFAMGTGVLHGFVKLLFRDIDHYFQATDLSLQRKDRQALRESGRRRTLGETVDKGQSTRHTLLSRCSLISSSPANGS